MNKNVHITVTGPQNSGTLIIARAILELLQEASVECSMPEETTNPTDGDSIETLGYLTQEVGPLRVFVQTRCAGADLRVAHAFEARADGALIIYATLPDGDGEPICIEPHRVGAVLAACGDALARKASTR